MSDTDNTTNTSNTNKRAKSKTQFILGLPLTMPAAEIIEKGKSEGYDLTPALVYKVRSAAKHQDKSAKPVAPAGKGKAAKKPVAAAPKKPAKPVADKPKAEKAAAAKKAVEPKKPVAAKKARAAAPKKGEDKLGSLSEFIRNLPVDMSPEEVVVKGVAAGLPLTASYVRRIRRRMDKKAGKAVVAPKLAAKKPEAKKPEIKKPVAAIVAPKKGASEGPDDVIFRQLVVNIGLPRAKVLLGEVEAKLSAIISGR